MRALWACAGTMAALGVLSGCASDAGPSAGTTAAEAPAARTLTARDFKGVAPAAAPAETPVEPGARAVVAPRPVTARTTDPMVSDARPAAPIVDAVAVPGAPARETLPAAKAAGQAMIVEGVVGQINGKPVYVNEVFDRLGSRLDRLARDATDQRDWLRKATPLIVNDLTAKFRDELMLAEARSMLTPEERKGLLAFLANIERNVSADFGGSRAQAEEGLNLTEEGRTLTDYAEDQRDQTLIRALINRYVTPRVNISWRDVEKEYVRRFDEYNPPAKVTLRVVQAANANAERVAKLVEAMSSGRDMEQVARDRSLNEFNAGGGGIVTGTAVGTLETAQLLADPAFNDAARQLSVGQTVGPIKGRAATAYIRLESVERPPGVPIQDAQLELQATLRERRIQQEFERYFKKLAERGSASDLREMAERLVVVADARYFQPLPPKGRPPAGR